MPEKADLYNFKFPSFPACDDCGKIFYENMLCICIKDRIIERLEREESPDSTWLDAIEIVKEEYENLTKQSK